MAARLGPGKRTRSFYAWLPALRRLRLASSNHTLESFYELMVVEDQPPYATGVGGVGQPKLNEELCLIFQD